MILYPIIYLFKFGKNIDEMGGIVVSTQYHNI